MTGPWIEAEPLLRLASALERFVWQGAAIGAAFGAVNALLSRAAPRVRYAVGCAALALMLAAPIATLASGTGRVADPRHSPAVAPPPTDEPPPHRVSAAPAAAPRTAVRDAVAPWLVAAWLVGVGAFSLRLAAGWLSVRRLRRRARPAPRPLQARLEAIAGRMGLRKALILLESAAVRVPGAVGALRPAILLPAGIATGLSVEHLEALLAHEVAHVARRDYLIHLLQAVAETLLFFHPAVWWVSHRIRVEREHACDDLAVSMAADPLVYARALLALEERRRGAAGAVTPETRFALDPRAGLLMSADGASLSTRIRRLVDGRTPAPAAGMAVALALASAAAAGAVLRAPQATPVSTDAAEPARPSSAATPPEPTTAPPTATPHAAHPANPARPARPERRAHEAEARSSAAPSADELIAFRIHGVTPEFIASIRAEGFERPSADDLLALRIHGVTPEYIRAMTAVVGRQPLEDYAAFRIHGLTPEGVAELRTAFGRLSADDALAMRIHGVTPEFVREMRAAGFERLGADDAVAFRIHGVTPEYAREMRSAGVEPLDADDALAFRIHGVTPEFAREMRTLVSAHVGADDLVAFRIHGVTPEFVRQIHELGYPTISADDLVSFRIHGISPRVVRELNSRYGVRLPADELIERRVHGDRYEYQYEEDER
jgi:beta-lactamase regulating signal transducer with metallopeptidase domain